MLAVAPALAIITVAIRLESPGPVLFRRTRVGRDGHRFEMLEFRSMVEGADAAKLELKAEAGQDGMFKRDDDPRVTRVGHLLRASSLDELPQLFNVIRGDMSLVGPRPLVVDEDALVQGWHRRRLHLVPGMTGPWQVLGAVRVPLQEMVKMDDLYIATGRCGATSGSCCAPRRTSCGAGTSSQERGRGRGGTPRGSPGGGSPRSSSGRWPPRGCRSRGERGRRSTRAA